MDNVLKTKNRCKEEDCLYFGTLDGLCPKHFSLKRSEKKKKSNIYWKKYHYLYYNVKWEKLRKKKIAINPLCEFCNAAGEDVDHIIDHKGNLKLFYDLKNLQTLCKSCHMRKTNEDLRMSKYPSNGKIITFIVDEQSTYIKNICESMCVNEFNAYIAKMIVKTENNTIKVTNKRQIQLLKREYILFHKIVPNFEERYEYKNQENAKKETRN